MPTADIEALIHLVIGLFAVGFGAGFLVAFIASVFKISTYR